MTEITREWIAKREQLEQAATEGPWETTFGPREMARVWTSSPDDGDALAAITGFDGVTDAQFIADARTSLPAALAALKAVLELHRLNREDDGACQGYTSSGYGYLDRWCVECSEQSRREYGTPWPCPTVAAVEAALRGES